MSEKEYMSSEEIRKIAEDVISIDRRLLDREITNLKIHYLFNCPNISTTVVAYCRKASPLVRFYGDADYIVEVSKDVWDALDDESKYILMLHELKHIKTTVGRNGKLRMCIAKHTVEDFHDIIEKYGIYWLKKIKTISSSVNNFENGEEDDISI